jgi:hypothetical protein
VRVVKFLGTILYVGYLVQTGLLMTMLPWSPAWSLLVVRLPPHVAMFLDWPAFRGAVTAFGVLHLALVAFEVGAVRGRTADPTD